MAWRQVQAEPPRRTTEAPRRPGAAACTRRRRWRSSGQRRQRGARRGPHVGLLLGCMRWDQLRSVSFAQLRLTRLVVTKLGPTTPCPKLAELRQVFPNLSDVGQHWPIRQNSAEYGPNLVGVGPILVSIGPVWPMPDPNWPVSAQVWSTPIQFRPTSSKHLSLVEIGPNWVKLCGQRSRWKIVASSALKARMRGLHRCPRRSAWRGQR